jgi:VanZ family protein
MFILRSWGALHTRGTLPGRSSSRNSRLNRRTRTSHMRRIFQTAGWLLASAITVLSLVPPQYRLVTVAAHNLEHLGIFLSVGIAFGAGYLDRPWAVAIGLASFSGAIEITQLWVPGRHARLIDFLVDTTATCIGIGLVGVVVRLKGLASRSRGFHERGRRSGLACKCGSSNLVPSRRSNEMDLES